jgi:hypothetical protein
MMIQPAMGSVNLLFGAVPPTNKNKLITNTYNIYRGTAPGTETLLAANQNLSASSGPFQYTDTTVKNGQIYYYKVTLVVNNKESIPSLEASAIPGATAGTTPTNVAALSTQFQSSNAWTDMTYLLDMNSVTWKYYLADGTEPDCDDDAMTCQPVAQNYHIPSFWNPLWFFTTIAGKANSDNTYMAKHIQPSDQFLLDVKNGTLPAVSWIVPNNHNSEHPQNGVQAGMEYVTGLVNAIMETGVNGYQGVNYWNNTVIFIAWDDWGGFYDHIPPPIADSYTDKNGHKSAIGYGIRVPGLIISPYVVHSIDRPCPSYS